MGFKDWYNAQNERNKEWKTAEDDRKATARDVMQRERAAADAEVREAFEGIELDRRSITFNKGTYPVAGAHAVVEIGGTQRRTTATRVVVGSVITLGIGTAIGAMAKKKTNNIYLSVELADGQVIIVEAPAKREGDARRFAAAVNTVAASAS